MAPTPQRIAQTSSEAKRLHKQNGPRLPERQLKQLERGHELDVRAARMREAEERRRSAKRKREERDEKAQAARKQTGVGLATQLIGYSHTQAQLKKGMEAFLGVTRRKEDAQRRRDAELAEKLQTIARVVEKEPWDDGDDDDDDDDGDTLSADHFVDNDLDDDALLHAHDLAMSDPAPEPSPPRPTIPTPTTTRPTPTTTRPAPPPPNDDANFIRLHGPMNKAVEAILEKLPEPLVELLSEDISLEPPRWNPAPGLLHKLNPVGLPPHRLRIKVASIVTLLCDLSTSSQLSKSQHLRIIRVEKDRLECLVLDGQLEGTKALLTRLSFPAKYRNDPSCPFQRTQFPIRVATDFTPPTHQHASPKIAFKLPSVPSHVRSSSLVKRQTVSVPATKSQMSQRLTFKLPGLPSSRTSTSQFPMPSASLPSLATETPPVHDSWDDFLDSGTQIARELSADGPLADPLRKKPITITQPVAAETIPPLSTQDLDFSMDDLDESPPPIHVNQADIKPTMNTTKTAFIPTFATHTAQPQTPAPDTHASTHALPSTRQRGAHKAPPPVKSKRRPQQGVRVSTPLDLTTLRPSQRPPSVSDRPGFKRKAVTAPWRGSLPAPKRSCAQPSRSASGPSSLLGHNVVTALNDFGISTQDVNSFFADDDELYSGSPPIVV